MRSIESIMKLFLYSSPRTLTEAIEPIFSVLRLAGLASRSDVTPTTSSACGVRLVDQWRSGEKRWKLRERSLLSRFYPLFVVLFLISCFALSQYAKHAMVDFRLPTTMFLSDWVTSSLTLFTSLSFVINLTSNHQTMTKIFDKLTYIDSHLLNDPTSVYSQTYRTSWFQLITLVIVSTSMTIIDFIDRCLFLGTTRALLLNSTQPMSIILDLALVQFINILLILKQRYKVLNDLIEDFSKTKDTLTKTSETQISIPNYRRDNSSPIAIPIMDLFTSFRTLRKIHFSLFEIASLLNSIHGFPLLSSMLCLFLNITFLSYVSIVNALDHDISTGWFMVATKFAWAIHYACAVVIVTSACHWTSNEAARSAILIHGCFMTEGLPVALSREMERFARQLSDVKLEFTAYGFFKLDFGLLFAMSGAISTYLVILVQFRWWSVEV